MKNREYGDYIEGIITSVNDIEEFTKGMDFDDFIRDRKTVFAVIRGMEVIGEAAKHIPNSARNKYPGIPWKDMTAMRDKITHEYFGVNLKVIWKTAKEDIPQLKPLVQNMLKDLGE